MEKQTVSLLDGGEMEIAPKMTPEEEREILRVMNLMCEQSLSPDEFEKWDQVKKALTETRKNLK